MWPWGGDFKVKPLLLSLSATIHGSYSEVILTLSLFHEFTHTRHHLLIQDTNYSKAQAVSLPYAHTTYFLHSVYSARPIYNSFRCSNSKVKLFYSLSCLFSRRGNSASTEIWWLSGWRQWFTFLTFLSKTPLSTHRKAVSTYRNPFLRCDKLKEWG